MTETSHASIAVHSTAPSGDERMARKGTGPAGVFRAWRHSLLGKTTTIFLVGVIFAYCLGAAIGWQIFASSAQEQWRERARTNIQIASATLRSIYTYIAVDADNTGQVNRIVTERAIGDDESVLYTGFSPADVLTMVSSQTKNDVWIFSFDQATQTFALIAGTSAADGGPAEVAQDAPLFAGAGKAGRLATGFTTVAGENYYAGLLPIVTPDGDVLGAVVTSVGRQSALMRQQDQLMFNSLVALVCMLILTTVVGTLAASRLFKPVPALIRATLRIASEQTDQRTPFQHRTDEIGDLAVAIEKLRGAVVERGHLRDIRDMAVELAHVAHHDPLTGLPNRALLMKTLEEAVAGLADGHDFNVLMLDLDRFKSVNDTLGHASGDNLLITTAGRLVAVLGPGDVAARLGGDEFAIIQRVRQDAELEGRKLATRLLEAISSGIRLDGLDLVVGTSIGIASAPRHGTQATQLLKNADLALYRAKASGRGLFSFFHDGMDMAVQDQHALELDLRLALQREEFVLHYQPIVDLATMKTSGFETLVRWRHPLRGMVPPDQFIPLAEETGMIVALGDWIIRQACRDAATWPEPYTLAVNLSPAQIQKPGFDQAVANALADANLPPSRLELEVTETVALSGAESVATLTALQASGIGIVLDDFGTGYASLSNLVGLPFAKIKIDRSFVANLATQHNCRAIVAAITGLAHGLNMRVTAEGVETAEQLAILQAAGCTNVQGYYFARPQLLDAIDLADPIAQSNRTAARRASDAA